MSDAIVIGGLLGAKAIPPFGIALSLVEYVYKVVLLATRVLFPTLTHLREQGNLATQRLLCLTVSRITFSITIGFTIIGSVLIEPFLTLWLGSDENTENILATTPTLFVVLGLAFSFAALQRPAIQLLLAVNKLRILAGDILNGGHPQYYFEHWGLVCNLACLVSP